MKSRNIAIIALLAVGMILAGYVHGVAIPKMEQEERDFIASQQNPLTHDIEHVMPYKNKYMGNAGNLGNLFHNLPLNSASFTFQLYPDELTAEIHYQTMNAGISEAFRTQAFIYNATAAFALIDNLEVIRFYAEEAVYTVARSHVEQWYGAPPAALLPKEVWEKEVQLKLNDKAYVSDCAKTLLQRDTIAG
ncbi:DUF4825 domain-containing protein [Paenibacillus spongiae]|uniref:DUF4825 domain-containing protein n=1 Tax=Paenibacillus spongiae TaxID=2909671 RepID=A0ABY5S898_9BACL|nr:DUF4825 domain-containing protein [Paenibacillus spongiae]UVI30136.1 DUF4825 domain-containing protein [Paenibacillus spongiae]